MTAVFTIIVVLVLAAMPSVLYLSVSRTRRPVTLTILAGVPLVLALCGATYVYSGGGEHAGLMFGAGWRILRVPLVLVAITSVLYLSVSRRRSPVMQDRQKLPRSLGRIAGEILAGSALGSLALLVVYVASIVFVDEGCYAAFEFIAMFLLFFPPLYGLGSAVGVYLVGTRGKQTGSFLLTLVGGFVGGLVAAGILFFLWATGLEIVLFVPAVLVGPIVAALGFNLTRRYKEPVSPRD